VAAGCLFPDHGRELVGVWSAISAIGAGTVHIP
jgi:hypothetical protein